MSVNITTNISSSLANYTQAGFIYYMAYAPCCPNNSNYDPTFNTTICLTTDACKKPGLFSALNIG